RDAGEHEQRSERRDHASPPTHDTGHVSTVPPLSPPPPPFDVWPFSCVLSCSDVGQCLRSSGSRIRTGPGCTCQTGVLATTLPPRLARSWIVAERRTFMFSSRTNVLPWLSLRIFGGLIAYNSGLSLRALGFGGACGATGGGGALICESS